MDINWQAINEAASADPAEVKAALPILYVMEAYGHHPALQEAGRWRFYSPFRDDTNPSFDVFRDRHDADRWGDFATGEQGDVLDLIGLFMQQQGETNAGFSRKMDTARSLLNQMQESGWTAPTIQQRKAFDLEAAKAYIADSLTERTTALRRFLEERPDTLKDVDADWLQETFSLGMFDDRIVVPYYNRADELVAYKYRHLGSKMMSAAGANYDAVLYGEWLDTDPSLPVLLCEGETDVWAAKASLGDAFAVLGLPTGGAAPPRQAASLARRTVYLALDADATGQQGLARWVPALMEQRCKVLVVPVPEGHDVADVPNLADLVSRSRPPVAPPEGAPVPRPTGYVRPAKGEKGQEEQLCNWTFTPLRELTYDSGSAYEGVIEPHNRETVITSTDLANKTSLVRWSNKHGAAWYGSDLDTQRLLASFQAAGVYLPSGRMTDVAGLHDGQYVWPQGKIGTDHWVYVPPATNVHLESALKIEAGPFHAAQVLGLRELHCHAVMDPILCWLAMAPLRALCAAFPILAVTGGSGTGKTTLLSAVIPAFSGSSIQNNLTGTTALPLLAYAGSTNAFPVWFDEYRPGARKDTLEQFDQILRDAYTGQASSKGGMGTHWAEVKQVRTVAPLIVSGENAFSETSHTERMILIHLPVKGRDADVLSQVQKWTVGPLAHGYLTWLYERFLPECDSQLEVEGYGSVKLPSRVRFNFGVLQLGWELLQRFLDDHGVSLDGTPDLSLVSEEARQAASSSPIRDALVWALEELDPDSGVQFVHEGDIAVRVESFVQFILRRGTFTLPGNALAVRKFLSANYGAYETDIKMNGRSRKVLLVPAGSLDN